MLLPITAILNASPTILLAKAGVIQLIPKLFTSVVIPKEVHDEIIRKPEEELIIINQLIYKKQITITKKPTTLLDQMVSERLGVGELAVISLSLKVMSGQKREVLAILDDKPARNLATLLGVKVLGTLGVLVLAKKRDLLDSQSALESLNRLMNFGGFFDPFLIEKTKLELKS
ncbi:MAG: hypothetical protein JSV04_00875 [Candidatus Heimdallarchaeota archaeon]|nr:MAG: hypothetical protein JSV04_00875 [Candidatus Heimdallarchaeota archaeon]